MKINLSGINKGIINIIKEFGKQADQNNSQAYLVGGIVRDMICKKRNLDIDIVIVGNAIKIAQSISKKRKLPSRIYKQFGTATLEYPNGLRVDVATARKESYPTAGALPVVKPGSIEDDLFRRDITINAIAMSINSNQYAQCVDPYDGIQDIRKKTVRILHDKSFEDDPTRILRVIRIEQRFRFAMEYRTRKLLKDALKKGFYNNVKPPRYFAEFRKILREERPSMSINRLAKWGGLDFLESNFRPDLIVMKRLERKIAQWKSKSGLNEKDFSLIYLMGLCAGNKQQQVRDFSKKFQLTQAETNAIINSLHSKQIIKKLISKKLPASKVYGQLNRLEDETIDYIQASTNAKQVNKYIEAYRNKYQKTILKINGTDLKKMGLNSGKRVGKVLDRLLMEKLDRPIRSRQEEIKFAKKLVENDHTNPSYPVV